MAFFAHVRPADVLLDADLRRLEAIALAHFMPHAPERMRRGTAAAELLRFGQIVLDADARKMLRDRLATPAVGRSCAPTFVVRARCACSAASIAARTSASLNSSP
jgi:hypothetical protein